MFKSLKRRATAQTFVEYTILFGVIVALLVAMSTIMRRSVQSVVKVVADEIGVQRNADQRMGLGGFMEGTNVLAKSNRATTTTDLWGVVRYMPNDRTETKTSVLSNLGFTERVNQ